MSANTQYQVLSDIEHVLARPAMYVGSQHLIKETLFVADSLTAIAQRSIEYIPALNRLFEEATLNALDHSIRCTSCNEIKVYVTSDSIRVVNNGDGIPIKMMSEGLYIPTAIFGMLRSGSSYSDVDSTNASINGLGIKLANIMSTEFTLETGDATTKQTFKQTWRNHMNERDEPIIKKLVRTKPFTSVLFKPDFEYFKLTEFSLDMIALMRKRTIDLAYNSKATIKVYFNDELIPIKKSVDYFALYESLNEVKPIVDETNERWHIGVAISSNGFGHASFVNGIHTSQGGSHVDHVMAVIATTIIDKMKSKKVTLKPSDVKNKLFVFIKSTIVSPTFDSQTKECLKQPKGKFGSEFIMSDAFKKKLVSNELMAQLSAASDTKLLKDLSKTSGTKTSRITGVKGLEDAHLAGTSKSASTRLILTEGLSAKTFAMSAITVIGNDRFGIFPLKGKLLNVRSAPITKVTQNAEIGNIVKILGLKYGEKYTDVSSLRYGGVIGLADSDVDGTHICALIMNVFHYFWPELLALGYFGFCTTPIVKVHKPNETLSFYTLNDFNAWHKDNMRSSFKVKYFKGLGTSTAAEARDALRDIDNKIITFNTDAHVDESINLAFNKDQADDRKEWLMERYIPEDNIDRSIRNVDVTDFINKELSHFSMYDIQRSIPSVVDGLKPSQRKILHTAIKHLETSEMKVAQFGAKVAEKTDYHHGEVSLMGAIVNMAQDYVGSNNMNLLDPRGAFGTRLANGADAASPRYIFTQLTSNSKIAYDNRDSSLLKYLESDGMKIEPEYFVPILPMVLVNGASGIGTGFSTSVLQYNPIDLCDFLIAKLKDLKRGRTLKPWYRGFKGEVEELSVNKYESVGVYTFDDNTNSLTISELPIGVSTDSYKEFLESLIEAKDPMIQDVRYANTDVVVNMIVTMKTDEYVKARAMSRKELIEKFKLGSKLSATNMYAFDRRSVIHKYADVYEIIDEHFEVRMEFYIRRRDAMIAQLEYELMVLNNKIMFIEHVKARKLDLRTITDQELNQYLTTKKFKHDKAGTFDYLINMSVRSMTTENVDKMTKARDIKIVELEEVRATTAKTMWVRDLETLKGSYQTTLNELAETMANMVEGKPAAKKPKARKTTKKTV